MFAMLGGILVLAGASLGLGTAGIVLRFSKSDDKRKTGLRLMIVAAIPVFAAATWWLAVVGFD